MSVFVQYLVLLLAIYGHSVLPNGDAGDYCICNDGLNDEIYQKNIDYACENGADCIPIMQNGLCFQPNTVKSHCNFAVNSYYQRNGQVQWSCSFSNTTTVTQAAPPATSECAYPSSPREVDPPKQQLAIHFSLSIKITLSTFSVVIVIVTGLLKLFKMYRRRTQLIEGESHQEEVANHHNGPREIEFNVADSPSTKLDIEGLKFQDIELLRMY